MSDAQNEREKTFLSDFVGERLTDDEVEQLIYEFEDKQGMVVYEDFIKAVLQR